MAKVAVHYFDGHLPGHCPHDEHEPRRHVDIIGGNFCGYFACFKPQAYPSVGRLYVVGNDNRWLCEERFGKRVMRDVTQEPR